MSKNSGRGRARKSAVLLEIWHFWAEIGEKGVFGLRIAKIGVEKWINFYSG